MNIQVTTRSTIDLTTIKGRQQIAWGSGDYAMIGTTLQIVGEMLCEAVDLRSNHRVLDVAAGNGNATLAAARRFAYVVSTDYVGSLLERGRERARAERLPVVFQEEDAESLSFPDASFDVVLSTFGVMFTPNQEQAAAELQRVCRPGGRIGLASWTPGGFVGQMLQTVSRYMPPPPGVPSPLAWGTEARINQLLSQASSIDLQYRQFVFRYRSAQDWLERFRTYYGPTLKAFAAQEGMSRSMFQAELLDLATTHNTASDGTLHVPSDYLEVVAVMR